MSVEYLSTCELILFSCGNERWMGYSIFAVIVFDSTNLCRYVSIFLSIYASTVSLTFILSFSLPLWINVSFDLCVYSPSEFHSFSITSSVALISSAFSLTICVCSYGSTFFFDLLSLSHSLFLSYFRCGRPIFHI